MLNEIISRWKLKTLFFVYPYDKFIDDVINKALDVAVSAAIHNTYYLSLYTENGAVNIWVENEYYGYASQGNICLKDTKDLFPKTIYEWSKVRPSAKTILRIKEYQKAIQDKEKEKSREGVLECIK